MSAETTDLRPLDLYTQIAYVVDDLEAAIEEWSSLYGAGPFYVFENIVEQSSYRGGVSNDTTVGAMGFLGATNIEFLQPTNEEPSIFREVYEKHGSGAFHHTMIMRVQSDQEFDQECERLSSRGLVRAKHGVVPNVGRVAYFDALDMAGQFIEVMQWSEASFPLVDAMYREHLSWDGSNPRRELSDLFG